jgi:hypothetical protein
VANVPGVDDLLIEVLKENIEWAKREKRTFLRQRLELKIAEWYSITSTHLNTQHTTQYFINAQHTFLHHFSLQMAYF